MNNVILKTICIVIIVVLLSPITVGLKHEPDDATAASDIKIYIGIHKLDCDGYLIYNVTCIIGEIDNDSILIRFYGSGPFTRLNRIDVYTELFIEHLSQGESGLFKTKDQVFRVVPIVRRPIVPFFNGEMETTFVGWTMYSHITIILAYCWQDDDYTEPSNETNQGETIISQTSNSFIQGHGICN